MKVQKIVLFSGRSAAAHTRGGGLVKTLLLIGTAVLLMATSASAQSSGPGLGFWGSGGGFGVRYPVYTHSGDPDAERRLAISLLCGAR